MNTPDVLAENRKLRKALAEISEAASNTDWEKCEEIADKALASTPEKAGEETTDPADVAERAIYQTFENEDRAISKGSPAYSRAFLIAALVMNVRETLSQTLPAPDCARCEEVKGETIREIGASLTKPRDSYGEGYTRTFGDKREGT